MIENTEEIISLEEESEDTNLKNPEPDLLIMHHNRKIKYWVDISQYDLETADVMMKGKRFLYVGFMCHQTVEKMLKAFYVFVKNDNPPYIHNLRRLAKQCEIYELLSEEQKDFIDKLTPLNIESRYPTYKENLLKSLDSEKSGDIICKTKELQKWIKQMLLNRLSEK